MKFLQATIFGFGKWTDTQVDFTEQNAASFYGSNEAGKSTLQQFILYMLFGLSPKQRKHYRPKQRTEIGGILHVHDTEAGHVSIQRKEDHVICFLEDGTEQDETWWSAFLSGLTKEMYTSIYAFSAHDLTYIQRMKQAELSDVLFSIGLTGSTAIYDVEKKLSAEKEKLFKKRGQKPLLNQQINKTDQLHKQLKEEQEKEAAYHALKEDKTAKEKELEVLQNRVENLQKENKKQENIKQNNADIHNLHQAKEQYGTFSEELTFPEEGRERLENIKQKNHPLQAEIDMTKQKQMEYQENIQRQSKKLLSEERKVEAEQLLKEKAAYEHREYMLGDLQRKLEDAQGNKYHLLEDLDWEDNKAQSISLPFHIKKRWEQLQENVKENNTTEKELNNKQVIQEEKQKELSQEKQALEENFLNQTTIESLRNQLNRAISVEGNQLDYSLVAWSTNREKQSKYIWYSCLGLAILTLLAALGTEEFLWYLFPFIFFILGIGQRFWIKQQVRDLQQTMEAKEGSIVLSEAEKAQAEEQIQQFDQQQLKWGWLDQQEKQAVLEKNQRVEEQRLHEVNTVQLKSSIQQERNSFPFLQALEPVHWLELLERIYALQEVEKQIEELTREIGNHQQQNRNVEEALIAYSEANTFTEIVNRLQEHTTAAQSIQEKEQEIQYLEEQKSYTEHQMNRLLKEKRILFDSAYVTDEEKFYKKANQVDEKAMLKNKIKELHLKLQVVFSEELLADLLAERPQLVDIDQTIEQNSEELKAKQGFIKETQAQIAQLTSSIAQLERQEDASLLTYQFEIEKDEMNRLGEQWSVVQLAHTALQKAKQSYQAKYMTEVMKWTTHFFKTITNNQYIHVHPPTEEELFQVEAKGNVRYTVDELSQGTVDQLYVSLRLSIAKVMMTTYQVPLLIDDAFVHFDDVRMQEALALLVEIAEEQQVLFFTCKQNVREALNVPEMIFETRGQIIG